MGVGKLKIKLIMQVQREIVRSKTQNTNSGSFNQEVSQMRNQT